ncbi:MAG: hypothetical protein RLZZ436_331 [Planctomycetota bacterium]|jgi:hypothetical protein
MSADVVRQIDVVNSDNQNVAVGKFGAGVGNHWDWFCSMKITVFTLRDSDCWKQRQLRSFSCRAS